MKLISNLLKLSLAPFGLVFGLSEVPLGIRNGFIIPNSFDPFRPKEFYLNFFCKSDFLRRFGRLASFG